MTNARVSRQKHDTIEKLIEQRNALIDTLNGILNTSLTAYGKAEVFIPLASTIGQKRYVVEVVEHPEGVILRQRRELLFNEASSALLIVPNPEYGKV